MDLIANLGRLSIGVVVLSILWTVVLMAVAFGGRHR